LEPTYILARTLLKVPLRAWFRWNIEGLSNIPATGGAVVAFNHIAYLDPLVAAYAIDEAKRRPRFLGKAELFADKRIGWILKGAGQIEVRRGTKDAPVALDKALQALDRGEVVAIFPEGTITTNADLQPIKAKTGISRMALRTGAPVIPAAIWGTANVWGKGTAKRWWPPRQDICIRIGKPMQVDGDPESPPDWDAAGAQIMNEISLLLAGLRPMIPDRRRNRSAA
jgi:1-acyl-sn-glycerol-3-phosphate acyltransferase